MVSRSWIHKALPLLALVLAMPAGADDFDDMVSAEKAFAADASARNTRDAFLAALADDGIVFAPGPSDGKRVWQARKVNKNRLEWAPEVAEIAASGDLGYTSGPWRFTEEAADKPSAFGHFFTIWEKQPDGKWKVLVDHGVNHGEVPFPDKVLRRGGVGIGTAPGWPVGMLELRTADLAPPGGLSGRLDGRKEEGDQDGDDCDHDEQLDQREGRAEGEGSRSTRHFGGPCGIEVRNERSIPHPTPLRENGRRDNRRKGRNDEVLSMKV